MNNHRAYHEALDMARFWRELIPQWTRNGEREVCVERARYWVGVARAIRMYSR